MMQDGQPDANSEPERVEIIVVSPVIACMVGLKQALLANDPDAIESWMDSLLEELTIVAHERILRPCPN